MNSKLPVIRTPLLATTLLVVLAFGAGCFRADKKRDLKKKEERSMGLSGELFEIAEQRGLDEQEQLAALKTFVPSGGLDTHMVMLTTGSSGRLAMVGLPSMRILKYSGLFTPEPWQGFGFDDESKVVLAASARDEISYDFGDSGLPAMSETAGRYDGKALFVADGANGRIAVMHLDDFEVKEILSNPVFSNSGNDVAVDADTRYVVQTTHIPQIPGLKWADPEQGGAAGLRGGLTFWKYAAEEGHAGRFDKKNSFTAALPPYLQIQTATGRENSKNLVLTVSACRVKKGAYPGLEDCPADAPGVLHVVDLAKAQSAVAKTTQRFKGHPFADLPGLVAAGGLFQLETLPLPSGIRVSPDGKQAVITHETGDRVTLVDLEKLAAALATEKDDFGVPTAPAGAKVLRQVKVGGATVDTAFTGDGQAFVSVRDPGKVVRLDLKSGQVAEAVTLEEPGGRLVIPQEETATAQSSYLIVLNTRPAGHLPNVGPQKPMNPLLFEIQKDKLVRLYEGAVPQATNLNGVGLSVKLIKGVDSYPIGTNPRIGKTAPYRTMPGNERVERKGNRVHVFGTVIRSHIVPDIVEVEVGDTVTFHLTNLEQAKDQTHGFTVSAYNVHSSWEPGKVASVTFKAGREGVFPYYCTEFCSALHLEMMGYLLVKPKNWKATAEKFETEEMAPEEAKKIFDEKMKVIKDTQAVIDSVVAWLKKNNYQSDPRAANFVNDAVQQLEEIEKLRPKLDAAVRDKKWSEAKLWAEQMFQYQVKAADAGLRAKKVLSEKGASK